MPVLLIPVDVCHALGPMTSSVSSKAVVSRTTVEGLPEGWIKEFRTRKRKGANSKDPAFCLDPSSDYALELNTTSVLILRSVLNISMGQLIKLPIGSTPFRIVYGKACHLPIELEHKAYWALKNEN
ncbi:hypothetical protein Tco_0039034 [Tanacetum coccineum]